MSKSETRPKITFLGASALSLAMLLELVLDQYGGGEVTIVQNSEHALDYPFEPAGIEAELVSLDHWRPANGQSYYLGVNLAETKQIVFRDFQQRFGLNAADFSPLLHSSAVLAASSPAGAGLVMHPLSVVSAQTQLGCMISINRGATVGHHSKLGDFCTLHPAANVAGRCELGAGVTLGMGCNVLDGVSIGAGTIVGAGALVTRDIPAGVIAYGQPAKVVRELEQNRFS